MIWPFTVIRSHAEELYKIETESQERLENLAMAENNLRRIAWLCRASFELGYRSGKPKTHPNEWRDAWRKSQARAELVTMGLIDEKDTYR